MCVAIFFDFLSEIQGFWGQGWEEGPTFLNFNLKEKKFMVFIFFIHGSSG